MQNTLQSTLENTINIPDLDSPAADKVIFGANELDRCRPNWFESIDLDRLDMASAANCVLAQLSGWNFGEGLRNFTWTGDDTIRRGLFIRCNTFHSDTCACAGYDELQLLWITAITSRRAIKESK